MEISQPNKCVEADGRATEESNQATPPILRVVTILPTVHAGCPPFLYGLNSYWTVRLSDSTSPTNTFATQVALAGVLGKSQLASVADVRVRLVTPSSAAPAVSSTILNANGASQSFKSTKPVPSTSIRLPAFVAAVSVGAGFCAKGFAVASCTASRPPSSNLTFQQAVGSPFGTSNSITVAVGASAGVLLHRFDLQRHAFGHRFVNGSLNRRIPVAYPSVGRSQTGPSTPATGR